MAEVEIRRLKKGQVFYEVDRKLAIKWEALEDARRGPDGEWRCLCKRKGKRGTVYIEFLDCYIAGKFPYYTDSIDTEKFSEV